MGIGKSLESDTGNTDMVMVTDYHEIHADAIW